MRIRKTKWVNKKLPPEIAIQEISTIRLFIIQLFCLHTYNEYSKGWADRITSRFYECKKCGKCKREKRTHEDLIQDIFFDVRTLKDKLNK